MLYKTISIVKEKNSANGNRIDGGKQSTHHIVLNLKPAACRFGAGKKITIFDNDSSWDELNTLFASIPADAEGRQVILRTNADRTPNPNFPEDYGEVEGGVDFKVNFPEGVIYARTYTANVLNSAGQIVHQKGELVCDAGGKPILHTSMSVFASRIPDPSAEDGYFYPFGRPEDKVAQLLKTGYVRIDTIETTTEVVETETPSGAILPPPVEG